MVTEIEINGYNSLQIFLKIPRKKIKNKLFFFTKFRLLSQIRSFSISFQKYNPKIKSININTMNSLLPMNPVEKNIRVRVLEALHKYGYKQVDVARETGFFPIFSSFLPLIYIYII